VSGSGSVGRPACALAQPPEDGRPPKRRHRAAIKPKAQGAILLITHGKSWMGRLLRHMKAHRAADPTACPRPFWYRACGSLPSRCLIPLPPAQRARKLPGKDVPACRAGGERGIATLPRQDGWASWSGSMQASVRKPVGAGVDPPAMASCCPTRKFPVTSGTANLGQAGWRSGLPPGAACTSFAPRFDAPAPLSALSHWRPMPDFCRKRDLARCFAPGTHATGAPMGLASMHGMSDRTVDFLGRKMVPHRGLLSF